MFSLKSLKVFAGTGEPQRAEMTLDVYGDVKQASETGDGPVDAEEEERHQIREWIYWQRRRAQPQCRVNRHGLPAWCASLSPGLVARHHTAG